VKIGIVPGRLFCSSNVTDRSVCNSHLQDATEMSHVYSIKCVHDTLLDIPNKLIQNYKTFFLMLFDTFRYYSHSDKRDHY